MAKLDVRLMLEFYENIYKTRRFEEELFEYYKSGAMPGLVHLSIGQEAVGTGAVRALRPDDFVGAHHRSHAHFFMRGTSVGRLLAEVLGKSDGLCKGKSGTLHCSDLDHHIFGLTGVLGANFAMTLGPAYWARLKGQDRISVVFTGDGTTNEGPFHEALNMAKAWTLPYLVIIENNLYGMYTDTRKVTGFKELSVRAKGYAIPGVTEDGNDVEVVYTAVKEAADYVRAGNGPMIVELMTYRTKGHHVGDAGHYKDAKEQAVALTRCPLAMMEKKLLEQYDVTDDTLKAIRADCDALIAKEMQFAENSPYPDKSEAFEDVYAMPFRV